jgi:hypothetical protein
MLDQQRETVFAGWESYMRCGNFSAAWRISDETSNSRHSFDLPRHLQTLWRGSSVLGKHVMVRCYRGLGDTIQFIRYAPRIKALAAELTVCAQGELIPLLKTISAIDRIVALDCDADPPRYDVEVEVTELPYIFRTTLDDIPSQIPYFDVARAPLPIDGDLAVGVVWAAGDWDRRRSIPPREIALLKGIPGAALFSFQRGPATKQSRKLLFRPLRWRNIVHEAGLLRDLDLLISVDSMPAHLAGALGVPVWLLLHADSDWRWMKDRDDSPWYPSMRLFRQRRAGDWQPVLHRVADELRALRLNRTKQESL